MGALAVCATVIGDSTMLSQIIRMVEQAQRAKLLIQALLDRGTMWFVPAVMAVAAPTFVAWLYFGHLLWFIRRACGLGFLMPEINDLLNLWRDRAHRGADVKRFAQAHINELREKIG